MTTAAAQKEKTILPAVHLGIMDILMKMAPLPVPKADDLLRSFRGPLACRHGHYLRPGIQSRQRHNQGVGSERQNHRQNSRTGKRTGLLFPVFEGSQAKNGLERSGRFAENENSFDFVRYRRQQRRFGNGMERRARIFADIPVKIQSLPSRSGRQQR